MSKKKTTKNKSAKKIESRFLSEKKYSRKRIFRKLLLLFSIFLVITFCLFLGFYQTAFKVNIKVPTDAAGNLITTFEIKKGAGVYTVAQNLSAQNIIPSELVFKILAKNAKLKEGSYKLLPTDTIATLINKFKKASIQIVYITIPEGFTVKQIEEAFDKKDIKGEFPSNIKEGSLFPDTYAVAPYTTQTDLIKTMQKKHDLIWAEAWKNRDKTVPYKNMDEALILASIVRREVMVKSEMPIVASVFLNRLRIGMALQADSTVIYQITDGYGNMKGRKLFRSALLADGPYNTYTRKGLPIGPICNVGIDSMYGVLHPATTKYLYFVADGTGGHIFAENMKDHATNVKEWRKIQKNYNLEKIRE